MCKLAGTALVLGGSLLYGICRAIRLKKRRDNLKAIERIVMYLESEIRYRHSLMSEAFFNAAGKTDKPFSDWLSYLADRLKDNHNNYYDYTGLDYGDTKSFSLDEDYNNFDFFNIWCESLILLKNNSYLLNEDIEELKALGQTLGYLDIEAHKVGMGLEINNLHDRITCISDGLKDRMRVSVIAGAVFGILVVVVLV